MKIKDIGERGLLEILQRFCPPEMVGDDAAILSTAPGQSLVVTTDMLVDGVHFSDRTTAPQDAGWRAAAANLSDLAAMGADPLAITVALGLSPETPVTWVEELYQGLTACLHPYHTPIVGGDIVRSPITTLSITAFGQINPDRPIRRSSAQPGYAILATGPHGAARAGLELLLNPEFGQTLTASDRASLIRAHQRPNPRLDVLPQLRQILDTYDPTSEIRVAGMDSSDGLADAIIQICQASGVGAQIQSQQIPIPPALQQLLPWQQAVDWALYGGEDFELVLCLPPNLARELLQKLGDRATILGTITPDPDIILLDRNTLDPPQKLALTRGFQHF